MIAIRPYCGLSLRSRSRGFTLIEIAVVIVVLSLLLAMIAGIATAMVGQQRREATRQRLTGVETAIALYVSQNKRLPCPADGRLISNNANAGLERPSGPAACQVVTGTANSQTHGVVPWRTLGLTEADVTDGWGNRLTYRVAPELVLANAMDFTSCDPGGSAPGVGAQNTCDTSCSTANFSSVVSPGCTRPSIYTANKGLKVRTNNATLDVIMTPTPASGPSTGAAYIVISHGENFEGAYNNQGVLQASTTASGSLEAGNNAANVAYAHSSSTSQANTAAFVDDFPSYSTGTGHFDDFVIRPSILTVATKAQLGPRSH